VESKRDLIEESERKIVDLQQQLRLTQEQRETGMLQSKFSSPPPIVVEQNYGGGRGRGRGRFSGQGIPQQGGRFANKWNPGRGYSGASFSPFGKNLAYHNTTTCLLVPLLEWRKLPDSFMNNAEVHFSR
jgi:hypothetical protein